MECVGSLYTATLALLHLPARIAFGPRPPVTTLSALWSRGWNGDQLWHRERIIQTRKKWWSGGFMILKKSASKNKSLFCWRKMIVVLSSKRMWFTSLFFFFSKPRQGRKAGFMFSHIDMRVYDLVRSDKAKYRLLSVYMEDEKRLNAANKWKCVSTSVGWVCGLRPQYHSGWRNWWRDTNIYTFIACAKEADHKRWVQPGMNIFFRLCGSRRRLFVHSRKKPVDIWSTFFIAKQEVQKIILFRQWIYCFAEWVNGFVPSKSG